MLEERAISSVLLYLTNKPNPSPKIRIGNDVPVVLPSAEFGEGTICNWKTSYLTGTNLFYDCGLGTLIVSLLLTVLREMPDVFRLE